MADRFGDRRQAEKGDSIFSGAGLIEVLGTLTIGIFLFLVRFLMGCEDFTSQGSVIGWTLIGIVFAVALAVARHLVLGPGKPRSPTCL